MAEARKKHAWTVSLTPFRTSGEVDLEAFRAHLLRLRDGGQSIYVGSTNIGEGFSLNESELANLLRVAVDTLKGNTPIRAAGIEARSTHEAVRYIKMAESIGVDAVHIFQLDTGHGSSKPDARELENFYSEVLDQTTCPVVLSNYPVLGYTVPIEVVSRLLKRFPQIIAFRDAGGDMGYFAELVTRFGGQIELYGVGVKSLLTTMFLGADGTFTTEANVTPKLVSSVLARFQSGDLSGMQREFQTLVGVHRLFVRYGGSAGRGMKSFLNHHGLPGGALRLPRTTISDDDLGALLSAFSKLDVPEIASARV